MAFHLGLRYLHACYPKSWCHVCVQSLHQKPGAIKLSQDMKREHLQIELNKLDKILLFLRDNCIDYPDDLNSTSHE
jgi:hypothetical protein